MGSILPSANIFLLEETLLAIFDMKKQIDSFAIFVLFTIIDYKIQGRPKR